MFTRNLRGLDVAFFCRNLSARSARIPNHSDHTTTLIETSGSSPLLQLESLQRGQRHSSKFVGKELTKHMRSVQNCMNSQPWKCWPFPLPFSNPLAKISKHQKVSGGTLPASNFRKMLHVHVGVSKCILRMNHGNIDEF